MSVFGEQEAKVLDCLKTALHRLWESSRYTIPVNQGQLVQARLTGGGAFTVRDTPAKSPPASEAPVGASRVVIVSPGPLEDLVAREAASVDQDEVLPASGIVAKTMPNKEYSDGHATKRPLESCSGATEGEESGRQREARAKASEDRRNRNVRGDVATVPARSLDLRKSEAGNEQPSTGQRVGNNRANQDSASNPATTGSNADAKSDANLAKDIPINAERQDRGGAGPSVRRLRSTQGREEEVIEIGTDNPRLGKSAPSRTGRGKSASRKGTREGSSARQRVGCAPSPPLPYDMQRILRGCRRASRLKRKRDAHNASADSFSAKLSGCGAKDQDSKAAARAFSRVLHKVGRALLRHARTRGPSSLLTRRASVPVLRYSTAYFMVVLLCSGVIGSRIVDFPNPALVLVYTFFYCQSFCFRERAISPLSHRKTLGACVYPPAPSDFLDRRSTLHRCAWSVNSTWDS